MKFAGSDAHVRVLADNMMDAWIAFARTGDPSHDGIGTWPVYNKSKRSTMIFGDKTGIEDDPFPEERKILSR